MSNEFNPEDRVRNKITNEEMEVNSKLYYYDIDKNQKFPNGKYECTYLNQRKDFLITGEFNQEDLELIE